MSLASRISSRPNGTSSFAPATRGKGCYKCGAQGHFAENCDASSRLCYNCKSPGHESSACPQPKSAEGKQCYSCGGIGHLIADCPSIRLAKERQASSPISPASTARCHNCNRPGHLDKVCTLPPSPSAARPPGSFGAIGRAPPTSPSQSASANAAANGAGQVVCYKCNGPNHFARDCLASGTTSAVSPNKGKCFVCHGEGHLARDCPNNRR